MKTKKKNTSSRSEWPERNVEGRKNVQKAQLGKCNAAVSRKQTGGQAGRQTGRSEICCVV